MMFYFSCYTTGPKMFPVIWSIVRPFLHENTAKKVEVLGGMIDLLEELFFIKKYSRKCIRALKKKGGKSYSLE